MAALPQRSRYPRPLKAMHTFAGGSSGSGQSGLGVNGAGSPVAPTTPTAASNGVAGATSPAAAALKNGHSSPPPGSSVGRRCGCSPEGKSCSRGEGVGEDTLCCQNGLHPRRSNSMGSLSEPDCYMNSLWPRLSGQPTALQCDSEEPLSGSDSEFNFSHKRSNSCSGDDRLKVKSVGLKTGLVPSAHTRKSVEGLNQEVSCALAGNPILLVEATPPDGHVAPVQDLLGRANVGTQTPPFSRTTLPSSQSPSPFPTPSSPSALPSSHTAATSDSTHSGTNTASPGAPQHPSSPKPSFAREPPDGAERCTIKVETSIHLEGVVPRGPDKSKGTIVFNKGTAFAPPTLTTQNLEMVP